MINGNRELIRRFIKSAGWITPDNLCYLFEGCYSTKLYHRYKKELYSMREVRDRDKRLRLIHNNDDRVGFVMSHTKIPTNTYNHDVKLRNCLALMIYRKQIEPEDISLNTFADAKIGKLYVEFDNGNEDRKELKNKILKYYSGDGAFRVLFIMATQYQRNLKENEKHRLDLLFEIAKELLPTKPNRVLGTAYSEYLKVSGAYNYKGMRMDA